MKRIGVLTGGGDCPGLNAVLRAVGKTLGNYNYEFVGFEDGFLGVLLERYRILSNADLSGILTLGGTILGTSNRDNPFEWMPPEERKAGGKLFDASDRVVEVMKKLQLEGLIIIGGDGSLNIAHRLHTEKGVNCIGVPKTIDNDLNATDYTFGFDTACQIATECIDRLHSTAMSHHRVMVVEIMGRYAGWLALYSGAAGGGDVILLPEIPYKLDVIQKKLLERSKTGKRFSIVVVAEGARTEEGKLVVDRVVKGSTDPIRLGGIAERLADQIEEQTGLESRATVLGHIQRGGTPTSRDRILATQFGHVAAELAMSGQWGRMSALQKNEFTSVPLFDAVNKLKQVPLDYPLVRAARAVGTSFGDE